MRSHSFRPYLRVCVIMLRIWCFVSGTVLFGVMMNRLPRNVDIQTRAPTIPFLCTFRSALQEEMRSQFEKQIQRADRFGTARPTVKEFYASLMIQTDNSSHAPNSADGRKGKGSAVEQGGRRRREPENGSGGRAVLPIFISST